MSPDLERFFFFFLIRPPSSRNRFSPAPFTLFKNRFGPVHFYHKRHVNSNGKFSRRHRNYTKSRPRLEHDIPTPEPIHSHLDGHGLPNVRDGRNFWQTRIYEVGTTNHCPTKNQPFRTKHRQSIHKTVFTTTKTRF